MLHVSPLHDLFAVDAAAPRPIDSVVRAAGSLAVVADISSCGHFLLGGRDGAKYLQGLVTNDVVGLAPGSGCRVAFLNANGRFEAVATVYKDADVLLLQTPPAAATWVETFLGRFRLAGDFQFERAADCAAFTIQGHAAAGLLGGAIGASLDDGRSLTLRVVDVEDAAVRIAGSPRSIAGGFDVVGPVQTVRAIAERLLGSVADPVQIATDAELDVLRMEAGLPAFQIDFDADAVLQEIDQPDIVSFHKGCYVGQEIVARIHFQGKPGKLLRRLELPDGQVPVRGDEILSPSDGNHAGTVTSVATSSTLGPIVFAMIKRRYYEAGTRVVVRHDGHDLPATVVERTPAAVAGEA